MRSIIIAAVLGAVFFMASVTSATMFRGDLPEVPTPVSTVIRETPAPQPTGTPDAGTPEATVIRTTPVPPPAATPGIAPTCDAYYGRHCGNTDPTPPPPPTGTTVRETPVPPPPGTPVLAPTCDAFYGRHC